MVKVGTDYTWDWGIASIFYSYFSKPSPLPTEVVVNPEPKALNLVSMNIGIDPSEWVGCKKGRLLVTFKVENLLDEKIYVPEFNQGDNPNSLPDGPGLTFYGGFVYHFE